MLFCLFIYLLGEPPLLLCPPPVLPELLLLNPPPLPLLNDDLPDEGALLLLTLDELLDEELLSYPVCLPDVVDELVPL